MSDDLGSSRRRKRANSGRVEWNTPQVVLDCIEALGSITLDPCWNPRSLVRAEYTWCLEQGEDGLASNWASWFGLVFVNPPYGQALKQWVPKMLAEADRRCEIIALLPNSTETRWFSQMHEACDSALAWRGRLTFSGAPAPAFFGSALFYFGPRPLDFEAAFAAHAYPIKRRRAA